MPSTIVHLALAGLICAGLLGRAFDRKAVGLVLVVVAFPDMDSFVPLVVGFGHRAVFHNLTIPLLAGALILVDVYAREESFLLRRWGRWGLRVAWVAVFCYAFVGVLLDVTDGVVNPLWPVFDQFYTLEGKIELSDQRGIVQTFIESEEEGSAPAPDSVGTTQDVNITTGIDPGPPEEPDQDPERIFPVIGASWELVVFLTGTFVTAMRFYLPDLPDDEE